MEISDCESLCQNHAGGRLDVTRPNALQRTQSRLHRHILLMAGMQAQEHAFLIRILQKEDNAALLRQLPGLRSPSPVRVEAIHVEQQQTRRNARLSPLQLPLGLLDHVQRVATSENPNVVMNVQPRIACHVLEPRDEATLTLPFNANEK